MNPSDAVFKFLGEMVAYGGGAAVIAYLLFQHLGKQWLENKFAQRLEEHKHQQAIELQRLRVEIDSLLSGALKIQECEFRCLPEAWHKLDEALGLVRWLVSPGQEYPNLDRLSSEELEEFLQSTEFTETQKERIRSSRTRLQEYQDIEFWHRLHRVKKPVSDLQNLVARNGIFFPVTLKAKFDQICELLWSAVVSKEVGFEAKDYKMQREGWTEVKDKAEPLYKAIEAEVQNRLHSHGRADKGSAG